MLSILCIFVSKYLNNKWEEIGLSEEEFLKMGQPKYGVFISSGVIDSMVNHYEPMSLQKLTFTACGLESQNCETGTTLRHHEILLFTAGVLRADFQPGLVKGVNESESDRKFMLSRWQY